MKRKIMTALLAVTTFMMAACQNASSQTAATSASSAAASSASSSSSASSAASETEAASSASEAAESTAEIDVEQQLEEAYAPILELPVADGEIDFDACIRLCDYKALGLTRQTAEVTDEDVDAQIDTLTDPVVLEDKDATVQVGDTVDLDYAGNKDGVAFDGGTGNIPDLVIGSGTFIPGFEEGLVGMKVGEERDLDLTFPENYKSADLAGAAVVFHCTLNSISRESAITNDWVIEQTDGEYTTVEEYRMSVKEELLKTKQEELNETLKDEIWDAIHERSEILQLPQTYIDGGIEEFQANMESQASMYGMTMEEMLEAMQTSQEAYDMQKEVYARQVAQSMLVFAAIAEKEGIGEGSEAFQTQLEKVAAEYEMDVETLLAEYGEDTVKRYALSLTVMERLESFIE